jgi:NAD(P)-dependent dehydrogenase (short-subunit alcohol dehydrogenase family)
MAKDGVAHTFDPPEGGLRVGGHLEGKVVAVTGGANGIGRAIALAAAEEGAAVVIADYGGGVQGGEVTTGPADAVVAEIEASGGRANAIAVDVSTMEGGRTVTRTAIDTFGRLDGLVCSAGIAVNRYIYEATEDEWDRMIAVHVKGHFTCVQAAAEVMMDQRAGHIVTVGSAAYTGMPNAVAYATAKAGILGFTWSVACALQPWGITCNCLVPSAATRMSDSINAAAGRLSTRVGDSMQSDLAEGTYRDPANVAPMAIYLLSDLSDDISGQAFRVQGYEIARMAPTSFNRTMTSTGRFDVDDIGARLPDELGPDFSMLPLPWPEPPDRRRP